jgi:hypothetical protein
MSPPPLGLCCKSRKCSTRPPSLRVTLDTSVKDVVGAGVDGAPVGAFDVEGLNVGVFELGARVVGFAVFNFEGCLLGELVTGII